MTQTEEQTRKKIIDQQLESAGWDVGDQTQVVEEFGITLGLTDRVRELSTRYRSHQFRVPV